MTLPAHHVVAAPHHVSSEAVAGRIVIIGGSFADGRDIYGTPIGPMPGAFLLVNSVYSLLHARELRHLPEWVPPVAAVGERIIEGLGHRMRSVLGVGRRLLRRSLS
jgi:hypothetical protein